MKPFALLLVLLAAVACGDDDGTADQPDAAARPDAGADSAPPLREDPCLNQEVGTACTWLGIPGEEGFTADGSNRFNTRIYWVMNMLFASDGFVYFDDWN